MHAENTVLFNSIKIPKSLLYIKKCIETGLSVPLCVFSLILKKLYSGSATKEINGTFSNLLSSKDME